MSEVDKIILLKNGNIIGMGTYDHLLETNSFFANFVSNSFSFNQTESEDGQNRDNKAFTEGE